MPDLVTALRVYDRSEALIARSLLDSEGIVAFVAGLDLLTTMPDLTFAAEGYRVQVRDADLIQACEILTLGRAKIETRRGGEDWFGTILSLALTIGLGAPVPLVRRAAEDEA